MGSARLETMVLIQRLRYQAQKRGVPAFLDGSCFPWKYGYIHHKYSILKESEIQMDYLYAEMPESDYAEKDSDDWDSDDWEDFLSGGDPDE